MAYIIKTSKLFEKDFARLDSITQSKILVILEKMRNNPFFNAKKLKNIDAGIFRTRVGDFRIRFDVTKNNIYLYCVRHRKEVYKK